MKPNIILDDIKDEKPKFKVGDLVKAKKIKAGIENPQWQIGLIVDIKEYKSHDPGRKYFKWRYTVAWPDGGRKVYSAGALVAVNNA